MTLENELYARRNQSVDTELIGLLDKICQNIEIPEGKYALAVERYQSIAEYLGEKGSALHPYKPDIFPQGSASTGTTVKPPKGNEFDVDLICQLEVPDRYPHQAFKQLIFERLQARGCYTLIQMNRCIRVQYVDEFHLDITPAIPDIDLRPENIKVTDKEVGCWKESNPKDYASKFADAARLEPIAAYNNRAQMESFANIEPLTIGQTLSRASLKGFWRVHR